MRFLELLIKTTAQNVMAKFGYGRRFQDLQYFEVGSPPPIFLGFITNLRASLQTFEEKHQFNVILSCFKPTLKNYMFNISTRTLLAPSSRICI